MNYPTIPSMVVPMLAAVIRGRTFGGAALRRVLTKLPIFGTYIDNRVRTAAIAAGLTPRAYWSSRATSADVFGAIADASVSTDGEAWTVLVDHLQTLAPEDLAPETPENEPTPAPAPVKPTPAPAPAPDLGGGLAKMLEGLQEALNQVGGKVDQAAFDDMLAKSEELQREFEELRALVNERPAPRDLRIHTGDRIVAVKGPVHKMFPDLLRNVSFRRNAWLYGPAGSAKTTAARLAARSCSVRDVQVGKPVQVNLGDGDKPQWVDAIVTEVIGGAATLATYGFDASGLIPGIELGSYLIESLRLAFWSESLSSQATRADLVGFRSALDGRYYGSKARYAFEHGALYCLDEIDASNPNVLTGLNELLNVTAGEVAPFPDGMVARHVDFVAVATANTIGAGASDQYVGRLPIDAATKDRFAFLAWNYDVAMEEAIVSGIGGAEGLAWFREVVAPIRTAITDLASAAIASPRMTYSGAEQLAAAPEGERPALRKRLVAELFANKIAAAEASRILARAKVESDNGWN